MSAAFYIRPLIKEDVEKAQTFLFGMAKQLFDMDRHPVFHHDIMALESVYIEDDDHLILGAFNTNHDLIGTIAVKRFVDRFESIKGLYNESKTAEIGRCYLDSKWRRKGVGSELFHKMVYFCKASAYEQIYLHTHRTLPGGFDFWLKMGFEITKEDDDASKTIHMEKRL
ncbi:GNAT family N-acetyltransferase [Fusibacter sp. 3D3]|uniref:GNAT family N-acetyltransferase n=1 Tax=Fusibacter sp. 3D3 TaxID=1048380 RepID=UPI0008539DC9|nr:GNAT family N-acetyltransferase [Fusibacter sp. 3D3]GAU76577.1 acetyltransferase [Fusibacter sp. 3D3]